MTNNLVESSNPMSQVLNQTGGAPVNQNELIQKATMLNAQISVAKQYERSWPQVRTEIVEQCQSVSLAENAFYMYPKGGTQVKGPSIRLVEVMASALGNIEYGIIEKERTKDYIKLESFAWDIQKNVRRATEFTIDLKRYTKKGSYVLSDERDIYEKMANLGTRRMRANLLALVPVSILDAAEQAVNDTLANNAVPINEQKQAQLCAAFLKYGVGKKDIEKYLGHAIESISRQEALNLSWIKQSLDAEMGKASDFFAGVVEGKAKAKNGGGAQGNVSRLDELLGGNKG